MARAVQYAFIVSSWTGPLLGAVGLDCWSGEINAEFCCDQTKGPEGDLWCWNPPFTFATCCTVETREPALTIVQPSVPAVPSCWAGDFTAELCCDLSKTEAGDVSCWDFAEFTFEKCCLGELPIAGAMLSRLNSWISGEPVDSIAGVSEVTLRQCVWAWSRPGACNPTFYKARQYVSMQLISTTLGNVCAPTACNDQLVLHVLIPVNMQKRGLLHPEARVRGAVIDRLPDVEVTPGMSMWLVAFALLGCLAPWAKPCEMEGARTHAACGSSALDWLAGIATLIHIGYLLKIMVYWNGQFPVEGHFTYLGAASLRALFVASAAPLEEAAERPGWSRALPGLAARRILTRGVAFTFLAVLTSTVFAQRMVNVNPFSSCKLRSWVARCAKQSNRAGMLADALLGLEWQGSLIESLDNVSYCLGWFPVTELRAWLISALLLLVPGGSGVFFAAPALLVWKWPLDAREKAPSPCDYLWAYLIAVVLARASRRAMREGGGLAARALAAALFGAVALAALTAARFRMRDMLLEVAACVLLLRAFEHGPPPGRLLVWVSHHSSTMTAAGHVLFGFLSSYEENLIAPWGLPLGRMYAAAALAMVFLSIAIRRCAQAPALTLFDAVCNFQWALTGK